MSVQPHGRGAVLRRKGKPTDWWFPAPGGLESYDQAKQVCSSCPYVTRCLEADARQLDPPHGMYGGLGANGRIELWRTAARSTLLLLRSPPRGSAVR